MFDAQPKPGDVAWSLIEPVCDEIEIYEGSEEFARTLAGVPMPAGLLYAAHFCESVVFGAAFPRDRSFRQSKLKTIDSKILDSLNRKFYEIIDKENVGLRRRQVVTQKEFGNLIRVVALRNVLASYRLPDAMFCPLCQEEYREGFSTCSGCQLALVATLAEAENKNARLWKGEDRRQLDEIFSGLDEAGIPRYYREEVSSVPRIKLFGALPIRPVFKYEVRVLKDDLPKAQIAIQQLTGDEDDAEDVNGGFPWLIRRTWSLSSLLAVASFFGLVFLAVHHPRWQLDRFIQGPVFRAGKHIGGLFSRDETTHELFGLGADVLFLMIFWFTVIWWIKQLRAERQDATMQNNS